MRCVKDQRPQYLVQPPFGAAHVAGFNDRFAPGSVNWLAGGYRQQALQSKQSNHRSRLPCRADKHPSPHLGKNNNQTTRNTFTTPLTPSSSFHSTVGSRCISGVAGGAVRGRLAPRSRASRNSSAVSKRWRLSRATAFRATWSSQMGTAGGGGWGARGRASSGRPGKAGRRRGAACRRSAPRAAWRRGAPWPRPDLIGRRAARRPAPPLPRWWRARRRRLSGLSCPRLAARSAWRYAPHPAGSRCVPWRSGR